MLTSNDSPLPSAQSNGLSSLTPDSASSNSNHTAESFSPSPSSAQVFNFNATTTNSFQMENLTATPKGTTGAKSVCFHSVMGQPGHKITNAIDCLQYMINGSTLIKAKASMRQYRRFYTLEEDLSVIRWVPSTKKTSKARLPVKSIREVRPGKNTEVLKNAEITGMYSEDCTFSIMFGDDYSSIDLIALSPEEANIWVAGLNFLIGLIKSTDTLEGREKMREKWLLDVFDEADQDRKGMLDELETIALMKRLNERLCIRSLKQKIVEFEMSKKNGEQRGCISKHAFISLFTQTATRPDIYFILVRYCGRDYMTAEEFQLFLEGEQAVSGTSLAQCQEMIQRFEPSDEARQRKQFLIDGFTQFILSEACDIIGHDSRRITMDMDQPFAHYYIASSHNTYLIEDQVKGPSSCDGYEKALLSGCRCIKVDTHDGPDGQPLVYHGNTLTSKISFSDVLETIRKHAFTVSSYPVILDLENHCSVSQQREMARLLTTILGDALFLPNEALTTNGDLNGAEVKSKSPSVSSTSSNDDADPNIQLTSSTLSIETNSSGSGGKSRTRSSKRDKGSKPSSPTINSHLQSLWAHLTPAQLQNKIIISGKKMTRSNVSIEEISDDEEGDCADKDGSSRKKVFLCSELSNLVSLVRTSPNGENQSTALHSKNQYEVLHLSESSAGKLALSTSGEDLLQRNKRCLTTVSPDVSRIDSSNLNPLDFWNCGVQLISMNYQTNGQIMDLYRGWFSQNGSCGYVLKPKFLCDKYSNFNARRKDLMPGVDPMNIRIKIISGQQLPRPKGASLKATSIDPYVTVQCLGVPQDCAEARTRTVSNDGHDPLFDESFEFNVNVPELALIRFLVLDDDFINDDFIGQLTIPVSSLHPGFKHVRLQNMNGEIIPHANLFVKISITNRYGSKQKLRRKRSWNQKNHFDTKQVGIKNIDEQLKVAFQMVHELVSMRKNVEKAILDLCDECSLPESANMAQCLRIITLRLASCATITNFKVAKTGEGYPHIKVSGELTPKLSRTMVTLDRTLQEFNHICTMATDYVHSLTEIYRQFSSINYEYAASSKENSNILSNLLDNIRSTSPKYKDMLSSDSGNRSGYTSCDEDFSSTGSTGATNNSNEVHLQPVSKLGLKFPFSSASSGSVQNVSVGANNEKRSNEHSGSVSSSPMGSFKASRKGEKVMENLSWNMSLIKAELDSLFAVQADCRSAFQQINRIAESLEHIFEREHKLNLRSNSYAIRELSNAPFMNQHPIIISSSGGGGGSQNQSSGSGIEPAEYKPTNAPLSPATSEGQLRGILKKSTSPTPMSAANGTNGHAANIRGHAEHFAEFQIYTGIPAPVEHTAIGLNHSHAQPGQYQQFHSDLNKTLEEKLHSLKNDFIKHD